MVVLGTFKILMQIYSTVIRIEKKSSSTDVSLVHSIGKPFLLTQITG